MKLLRWSVLFLTGWAVSAADLDLGEASAPFPSGGLIACIGDVPVESQIALVKRGFVVHSLVEHQEQAEPLLKARAAVQSTRWMIHRAPWTGSLPYADRLLNGLVCGRACPAPELTRVLAPRAIYFKLTDGGWVKQQSDTAPREDAWPQFRHDAARTKFSRDQTVGLPEALRWTAGPLYQTACIAVGGEVLFQIELPHCREVRRQHTLHARDARNGVLLWSKPFPFVWRRKGAEAHFFGDQADWLRFSVVNLGERTVLNLEGLPVVETRTGKIVGKVAFSGDEIVRCIATEDGGLLALGLKTTARYAPGAFEQPVWQEAFVATCAAVQGKMLVHLDASKDPLDVVGRDLDSGAERWRVSAKDWSGLPAPATWRNRAMPEPLEIVCIAPDGGVVLHAPKGRGVFTVLEAETGAMRWTWELDVVAPPDKKKREKGGPLSARFVQSMALGDGLLWISCGGSRLGLDLRNHQVIRQTHHHQTVNEDCQRHVTTPHWVLTKDKTWVSSETADQVLEPKTGAPEEWRKAFAASDDAAVMQALTGAVSYSVGNGRCRFHIIPAYGLSYVSPKDCNCTGKGFGVRVAEALPETHRTSLLRKGDPLVETIQPVAEAGTPAKGWSTLGGGARRSNQAPGVACGALTEAWRAQVAPAEAQSEWLAFVAMDGRLSAPVADARQVVVADQDGGALVALDAALGKERWRYQTGGRIGGAPTLAAGGRLVLAGSEDGFVYAVDSAGKLRWRTRPGGSERLIAAHGRIASPWAVQGDILVAGERAVAVCGWLPFAASGVWHVGLDLKDGSIRWKDMAFQLPGVPVSNGSGQFAISSASGIYGGGWGGAGERVIRDLATGKPAKAEGEFPFVRAMPWNERYGQVKAVAPSTRMVAHAQTRYLAPQGDERAGEWEGRVVSCAPELLREKDRQAFQAGLKPVYDLGAGMQTDALVKLDDGLLIAAAKQERYVLACVEFNGKVRAEIELPARAVSNGLAVAGKQVVVSCRNGILCAYTLE